MRVITGSARGRKLLTLEGEDVRPTTDRVKEAVFSVIQFETEGRRFLDLFAGSGQMGIEALSRGAAYAVLCDKDRAALQCIRKNIGAVRCGDRCSVFSGDYAACIRRLSGEEPFSLVFLDPPYRMENTGEICARLLEASLLCADALIVVEHRRGTPPVLDARFAVDGCRRYGDTEISFVRVRQGE